MQIIILILALINKLKPDGVDESKLDFKIPVRNDTEVSKYTGSRASYVSLKLYPLTHRIPFYA